MSYYNIAVKIVVPRYQRSHVDLLEMTSTSNEYVGVGDVVGRIYIFYLAMRC